MDSLINAMSVLAVNESIHLNEAYKLLYNDLTNSNNCRNNFPEIIEGDWIMYEEYNNYKFGIITKIDPDKIFYDEENTKYFVYLFSEKITEIFSSNFMVSNANVVSFEIIQEYIKNINDINIRNSMNNNITVSNNYSANMETC